jgi:N6-L-threonylcarbamoyladenine synthase
MTQSPKTVYLLAIESSCDDTSAAVFRNDENLANLVATQDIHRLYGGVVPEMASRAHLQNIIPVVDAAMQKAGITLDQLNAIAFTRGPGLIGSLLVGATFAKGLALTLGLPLIEVNHMQAHVLAHFIENPKPSFPFLCLTVSGGHTQIVLVRSHLDMEVLGNTTDDAAGEAFDKTAKILGLPYPGGPLIDKYAQLGNPQAFTFGKPKVVGLDFSFSGFKTSVLYAIQKQQKQDPEFIANNLNDLCASIQRHIIEMLMDKLELAAKEHNIKEIAIAGGVSANSGLRKAINETGQRLGWNTYIPRLEYCTDNAAMIGITAYYKYLKGEFTTQDVSPVARYAI